MTQPEILWSPSERAVEEAQVTQFARQMVRKHKLDLNSYPAFHQWSVDNPETFWSEVWDFCGVIASRKVMAAYLKRMPDVRALRAGLMQSKYAAEVNDLCNAYLDQIGELADVPCVQEVALEEFASECS